jgi:aspartate carbamoyltransferase regulatory subunit
MTRKKQLIVSAIKNGTVIDHIPADKLFKVLSILDLEEIETQITFGTNLESKNIGKKAILKLSDVYFYDSDINRIALVAPHAKLNIIRDYRVAEKKVVEIPDMVYDIAKCFNPQCITNHEHISTKFKVLSKKPVALKCMYCEKITDEEQIVFK